MLTHRCKVIVNSVYLRGCMLTTSTRCMLTRWYSVNTPDLPLIRAHPIYGCTVFCVNEKSRDYWPSTSSSRRHMARASTERSTAFKLSASPEGSIGVCSSGMSPTQVPINAREEIARARPRITRCSPPTSRCSPMRGFTDITRAVGVTVSGIYSLCFLKPSQTHPFRSTRTA